MALFSLPPLPVLVSQCVSCPLHLPSAHLPKGLHLVTLQLEVASLLTLTFQLLPQTYDVFLQLQGQKKKQKNDLAYFNFLDYNTKRLNGH